MCSVISITCMSGVPMREKDSLKYTKMIGLGQCNIITEHNKHWVVDLTIAQISSTQTTTLMD